VLALPDRDARLDPIDELPARAERLAAMRARNRFGIAIAAMMRMIATTMSSSIREKPF